MRVASKRLGGGRYYGKKAVVRDVTDAVRGTCTLLVGGGQVLEGVAQRQLETALPKAAVAGRGGEAVVLGGKRRGRRGRVLERRGGGGGGAGRAVLQLYGEADGAGHGVVRTFSYDDVAEYTRPDDDLDFVPHRAANGQWRVQ